MTARRSGPLLVGGRWITRICDGCDETVATADTTGPKAGSAGMATRATVSGKRLAMYRMRAPLTASMPPSASPVVSVERSCALRL